MLTPVNPCSVPSDQHAVMTLCLVSDSASGEGLIENGYAPLTHSFLAIVGGYISVCSAVFRGSRGQEVKALMLPIDHGIVCCSCCSWDICPSDSCGCFIRGVWLAPIYPQVLYGQLATTCLNDGFLPKPFCEERFIKYFIPSLTGGSSVTTSGEDSLTLEHSSRPCAI